MINAFENLMSIELNEYGFQIDTAWCYVALSWQLLITTALVAVAYKIYKRKKAN